MLAQALISFVRPLVDRFPRIASTYRTVRDQLDPMDNPVVTPWGFRFAGNAAMAAGTFEPAETALVRDLLAEVDILVNIGANVGYYCCHALSLGKAVIAFEPIDRNLRYLYRNIKSNGWSDCEVYPIALTDRVGVLDIYGGDTGASVIRGWAGIPGSYATLVPSSTMDVVLGTRLEGKRALIVADVEGAEKLMLDGATMVLANEPKPVWLVEITSNAHQPRGVGMNPHLGSTFALFLQNGYEAFAAARGLRPVTMEQVDLVVSGSLEFSTHNFLFREPKGA